MTITDMVKRAGVETGKAEELLIEADTRWIHGCEERARMVAEANAHTSLAQVYLLMAIAEQGRR